MLSRRPSAVQEHSTFIYGSNCPGRIFSPKVVTFLSTSTAVFEHFWRWVTCFVWYFWSIMSAGVSKNNFWTYHLMKTTWKPPLNMGDFEFFTHFFSFCTTFLCFRIKPKPSRTLVLYLFYVWKLFFLCFSFLLSFLKAMLLYNSAICGILV